MLREGRYNHRGYRYSSAAVAATIRRQEGLKRCARCEVTQPVDQFHRDQSRPDGLYSYCLSCCAGHRDQNREQRRASDRARYAHRKHPDNQ